MRALVICCVLAAGCSKLLDFDALERGGDGGSALDAGSCPTFPKNGPTFSIDDTLATTQWAGGLGIGDFDEDGHVDLVYGLSGSTAPISVSVISASKSRVFAPVGQPSATLCSGTEELTSLVVGDFDGDEHLDVVVTCTDNSSPTSTGDDYLLPGNGHGGFATPRRFANPVIGIVSSAADLNGDGVDDLVLVSEGVGIAVYFGGATIVASTPVMLSTGPNPAGVAIASIVDGQSPTIVVANSEETNPDESSEISTVMAMKGSTSFGNPTTIDASSTPVNGVVFGQFNDDRYRDALFMSAQGPLQVMFGESSGMLGALTGAGSASDQQSYAAVGDLDCDGIDDVVITRFQSNVDDEDVISVLRGSKSGAFSPFTTPTFPNDILTPAQAAIADFDGDGRLDIAVVMIEGMTGNYIRLFWSDAP